MTLAEKIAELRVLMEKATPGPWDTHGISTQDACSVGVSDNPLRWFVVSGTGRAADDALLIVAMRNHLPEILTRMDALEAAIKKIDHTLRVPAAEYVPVIGDVFTIIDSLARLDGGVK
jgi:hypothetical protein